jgi:type I restriction enzyme S subunit
MSARMLSIRELSVGVFDGPHATPELHDSGAAVFLGIPNIRPDGSLDLVTARWVNEKDLPKWNRRVTPQARDIVFTYEATLNRYALIPEGLNCTLGRRTALIRPNPEVVDHRYLYYYFYSAAWRAQIDANTLTGATVDRIPLTTFPDFKVFLPDLKTQRVIAETLSTYDDLIANNQRRITLLEQAARLLYREWFVHLRFPGHGSMSFQDGLPEGWRVGPLGGEIKTSSGGTPSRKRPEFFGSGIPWLKTQELNDGILFGAEEEITEAGLQGSSAKVFPAGTVLLAMYGATIGRTALLARPAATNQACCAFLVADSKGLSYYCFQWLKEIKQELVALGMGAAQPNLSQEVIRKLDFLLPSYPVLEQYHSAVAPLFDQLSTLCQQSNALARARDLLLPKLMSGQMDVSRLPLPEVDAAAA